MVFDVAAVRGLYVSLADGWTYLNAQERSQTPERVSSVVSTSVRTSRRTLAPEPATGLHSRAPIAGDHAGASMDATARAAFADLVGASAEGVVLGHSREQLMADFADAMQLRLGMGTEMVLSRSDDAEVQVPLRRAADLYGSRVRMAEADLSTGTLPHWQYEDLVNESTRLVSIPAAHSLTGALTAVRSAADVVRARSQALVLVDASAVAPYRLISLAGLGADAVLVDAAAWGGPDVAALIFRDPAVFRRMKSRAIAPNVEGARKLELGRLSPTLLGAVATSIDHLALLNPDARGTRRRRLELSMPAATRYLSQLDRYLIDGLRSLGVVYLLGIDGDVEVTGTDPANLERIPRISFLVRGVPADRVAERLLDNGLVATVSGPGTNPLIDAMGAGDVGGAVTVGLSVFNTTNDVDHLLRAVASLA